MTTRETNCSESQAPAPWKGFAVFFAVAVVTFVLGLLVSSILDRRREANLPPQTLVPVPALEGDNAKWGVNYPREYASWKATAEDGFRSTYGGAVKFSHLTEDPRLKVLFQGYPFAVEYNDDRGHMHALEDVRGTARVDPARGGKPQPGTCLTCKSSDVPALMQKITPAKFYSGHFKEISDQLQHPIGCADCHDANTMALHISRPALREAFAAMGKDINTASHQEMRSLVCAQCHVEYFFAKTSPSQKKGTYLTFPWKHGTTVEAMERFYQSDVRHVDWKHPVSGTEMIKMQHPDYEIYRTGVHAFRGVACADCHMPYRSEGGIKYSDHHIQSPLRDVNAACGTCHRWSDGEATARVTQIQNATKELLDRAEIALVAAHTEVGAAANAGATDAQLAGARDLIRRAQLRWDYVAANNGMGFHSPQECARVLGTAIDLAQQARLAVAQKAK